MTGDCVWLEIFAPPASGAHDHGGRDGLCLYHARPAGPVPRRGIAEWAALAALAVGGRVGSDADRGGARHAGGGAGGRASGRGQARLMLVLRVSFCRLGRACAIAATYHGRRGPAGRLYRLAFARRWPP